MHLAIIFILASIFVVNSSWAQSGNFPIDCFSYNKKDTVKISHLIVRQKDDTTAFIEKPLIAGIYLEDLSEQEIKLFISKNKKVRNFTCVQNDTDLNQKIINFNIINPVKMKFKNGDFVYDGVSVFINGEKINKVTNLWISRNGEMKRQNIGFDGKLYPVK